MNVQGAVSWLLLTVLPDILNSDLVNKNKKQHWKLQQPLITDKFLFVFIKNINWSFHECPRVERI